MKLDTLPGGTIEVSFDNGINRIKVCGIDQSIPYCIREVECNAAMVQISFDEVDIYGRIANGLATVDDRCTVVDSKSNRIVARRGIKRITIELDGEEELCGKGAEHDGYSQ
jgi:hypothetical protein